MDYKELIEDLRHAVDLICVSDLYVSCENELRDAATAIETLLKERDAAMKDLRGICWCCANGQPWDEAGPLSKMTGCEQLSKIGVLARGGGKCKCLYWKWRGPQREEKPHGN